MYHSNPVAVTVKKLRISYTWLYHLLDVYNIERKGYGGKVKIQEAP